MKKNIYIFTRCIWTFINFRYDLVNKIDKKKYNVYVCMDFDGYKKNYLEKKYNDIKFKEINFLNQNNSFLLNIKILTQIFLIFIKNNIHIAHNFTARPIVFVSLVSIFFLKTKVINTITGLGNNFFANKIIYKYLYNLLFLKSYIVVFQNNQDKKIIINFLKKKINKRIIYPSVKFKEKESNSRIKIKNKIVFLMHSRMIKQKGVIEFIDAIKKLNREERKRSLFFLIGNPDKNNPSSISQKYLNKLQKHYHINYIRHQSNISKYLEKSDVIVLPSYGEGLPASLLEGLFFKKAIITTKTNGCSEMVIDNYNGFLVRPKNSSDIYKVIKKIIKTPHIIMKFKQNSYRLFQKKFDKDSSQEYLRIYDSL